MMLGVSVERNSLQRLGTTKLHKFHDRQFFSKFG